MKPKSTGLIADKKQYPGFTSNGRFFWSETYVDNSVTEWVRNMIDQIPRDSLAPADVIGLLRQEPKWIQDCFSPYTVANWVRWERMSDWPFVDAPSSFTRCLKDFGRGYPLWFRDEKRWTRKCNGDEGQRQVTSRFEGLREPEDLVATLAERLGSSLTPGTDW